MKKAIRVISLVLLLNLPISCVDDCGGRGTRGSNSGFSLISGISVITGSVLSNTFSANSSLNFELAAVKIMPSKYDRFGSIEPRSVPFSTVATCYACSPVEPASLQKIKSFSIVSDQTVNSNGITYPTNTELRDLFHVLLLNNGIIEKLDVDKFIMLQNENHELFGLYGEMIIQLKSAPDIDIDQVFTIAIAFDGADPLLTETTWRVKK
jgi:hypothetical protein